MPQPLFLVDQDFEKRLIEKITERILDIMKSSLSSLKPIPVDNIQWYDTADMMKYVNVCRRTLLTMRRNGLPFTKRGGKVMYRKDLVDTYLSDNPKNK
jgi:hypothetical protein